MNSGNGFFFLLETWLFLPATEGSVQPATNNYLHDEPGYGAIGQHLLSYFTHAYCISDVQTGLYTAYKFSNARQNCLYKEILQ